MDIFKKLDSVVEKHEQLTEKMSDPKLYDNPAEYRRISTEHKNLEEIVEAYKEYKELKESSDDAKDILKNEKDEELKEMAREELAQNKEEISKMEHRIKSFCYPRIH